MNLIEQRNYNGVEAESPQSNVEMPRIDKIFYQNYGGGVLWEVAILKLFACRYD
jgi:hypothetical protein